MDQTDGSSELEVETPKLEPRLPQAPSPGTIRRSVPDPQRAGSAYPPIAEYGFLSDCETVALLAPNGGVEWMCLPRVDSPIVFGAMLDRDAGYFRLGPAGVSVPASRRYLPGTMVLETSWNAPAGSASDCSVTPARWGYTPRRSTPAPGATWGTTRRPSPISH